MKYQGQAFIALTFKRVKFTTPQGLQFPFYAASVAVGAACPRADTCTAVTRSANVLEGEARSRWKGNKGSSTIATKTLTLLRCPSVLFPFRMAELALRALLRLGSVNALLLAGRRVSRCLRVSIVNGFPPQSRSSSRSSAGSTRWNEQVRGSLGAAKLEIRFGWKTFATAALAARKNLEAAERLFRDLETWPRKKVGVPSFLYRISPIATTIRLNSRIDCLLRLCSN